ncbi:hypothetical protein [Nocardioides litoris]|uniref:hypothetical protein n=1 Tax=Nocardioides litoris TaxID=1926648 RepID=UPI00111E1D5C|nr:hypothetical protein [Nocardioides litoris]
MSARTPALALAGLLAGPLLAVTAVTTAAPAQAQVLPSDDVFLVYAGSRYTLAPLANDGAVGDRGRPRLCGLRGGHPSRAYVETSGDRVVVEALGGWRGTLTYTYDVCDGESRASATMTVEVDALLDLRARRKRGAPGAFVVRNPNQVPVTVSWGSESSGRPSGTRSVPANRAVTLKVRQASAYWVGFVRDRGVVVTAGDGVVRGLRRR